MNTTLQGKIMLDRFLFIWKNLYYLTIMSFILCGLICCNNEETPNKEPLTGDQVLVQFSLIEETLKENKANTPVTERQGEDIAVIPVEGDMNMYVSLEVDQDIKTRASSPLEIDKRVRIVAYRVGIADTTYVNHVDYKMTSVGLIPESGPGMTVNRNSLYIFVAYTYNKDATLDDHSAELAADTDLYFDISALSPFDLSWGSTTQYISSVTHTVQISMAHLFAKVKVQATTGTNGAAISSISNLTIPGYKFNFHIRSGKVTPDLSGMPQTVQIPVTTWAGLGTNFVTSDSIFTYYFDPTTPVMIDSMTIGGISYKTGPYTTSFGPLLPGYSYTLRISFQRTPTIKFFWYKGFHITGVSTWTGNRLVSLAYNDVVFSWDHSEVQFDIVSTDGCIFDAASSVLNGGSLVLGTPFMDNGNSVYPYSFTFNNTNYLTVQNYSLKFTTNALDADVTLRFRRGIQEWILGSSTVTAGYKGISTATPAEVIITHNLGYSWWFDNWMLGGVSGGGSSWAQGQRTALPAWYTPSGPLAVTTVTSWLKTAYSYPGSYPAPGVLTNRDTVLLAAAADSGPMVYAPAGDISATRSVQQSFQNLHPTTGINPVPFITLSQYRPRIYLVNQTGGSPTLNRWPTFTSSGIIPQAGGTFTFIVSTNLTGWGIRVYGTNNINNTGIVSVVQQQGTAAANDAAGSNVTISVTIPATTVFRTLSFYLYASESGVTNSEIKFAEVLQDGNLIVDSGAAGPRIFIQSSGETARLMLTQSPDDFGAYFQYGGVIGWAPHGNNGSAGYNPSLSGSNTWSISWNIGNRNVPHTNAELKLGIGDACRLLGFTVAQIKESLNSGNTPDNKRWRLPGNDYEGWAVNPSTTKIGDVTGLMLGPTGNRQFMPFNGYRRDDGVWNFHTEPSHGNGYGGYWDSGYCTTHYYVHGLIIMQGNSVSTTDNTRQQSALGIRCVPQ